MSRRKQRRIKLRSMYNWHRYLGVTAAIFVVILALSGLALNHTEQLNLDERHIKNSWLLAWYGIPTPEVRAYRIGNKWISQWGDCVFMETHLVSKDTEMLIGAVDLGHMIVLGFQNRLSLLTPEGQHIESLGIAHGLPDTLKAIGLTRSNQMIIKSEHGFYISEDDFTSWSRVLPNNNTDWANPGTLPDTIYHHLFDEFRGNELTAERIMLDLHSGRIFGNWGVYLMDGAAIILLFLAGSGVWIWVVRHVRQKNRAVQKTNKSTIQGQVTQQDLKIY